MDTIKTYIDRRAERDPHGVFLIAPETGSVLDNAELRAQVRCIGCYLDHLGVPAGRKVAFLLDNGLWTTVLFLGVMYAGRTVVPLNAVAGGAHIEYVLAHSDAELLFVSERYREEFGAMLAGRERAVQLVPACADTGPDGWLQAGDDNPGNGFAPVASDDPAVLIYTSGTTGTPKGVLLSHANLIAGGMNTVRAHGLQTADRALCVLPLYHINGEVVTVIAPLLSGGGVVMPRRFSVERFWDDIAAHGCTWFSVVPTIIAYLLDHAERDGRMIKSVQHCALLRFGRSASAPLAPRLHRDFERRFSVPLVETMGLTETAAQILSNPPPPTAGKPGSPGFAVGNEVKIVDEWGCDAPAGKVGELWVRGANVMRGYYKNPQASAAAIDAAGWLRTGDLGYRDDDGYFFIVGRIKELIIKGGENIAPREIDEALCRHPAVLEAAAFAVPDRFYGQDVMACAVLKPGVYCSEDELLDYCRQVLGEFKTPKCIGFIDVLPKGPSGKVQRLKLATKALG